MDDDDFEWDEAKRQSNLAKHRLDFRVAASLFDGRPVSTAESPTDNEMRFVSTMFADGRHYTVVWTVRSDRRRIISFRRARDEEERRYRQLYG
jgi:uncharacterized DUF497 family protein